MNDNPESTTPSLSLENISTFTHPGNVKPPKLRSFRVLQAVALMAALVWLIGSVLVSRHLIEGQLKESLYASNNYVTAEAGHLVGTLSQNLYRAEQLSKTLSFNQSVIDFTEVAKKHSNEYKNLAADDRHNYILNMFDAKVVNNLFEQLAHNVDLYQILLQDESGYCIGSSRARESDGCIGISYQTREYFQKAKQDGGGRQFAIGQVVPVPSFFFSTGIKKEGDFLGAVVVRQDMQQIIGFLNHQKALAFMTGIDGVILSSSQDDLIYKYIGSEFSPSLDSKHYQKFYHRKNVESLDMERVDLSMGDFPFVKMNGKMYLLGKASVAEGDFTIFILENIDPAIHNYYTSWKLAMTIVLLGLLLIWMVERNLNHSQHRAAHLNALSKANKNLALLTDDLYELSVTDALTSISNRRFFNERLQEEINRAQRKKESSVDVNRASRLTLMIIDIDNFKKINDTYGHPAGDKAIRIMANICKEAVRQYDCVGRIGGEEFAVLLTDADSSQAKEIAERIRKQCEKHVIQFNNIHFMQTCSIGIASFEAGDSADSLLSKADKALYAAKSGGRNRFVCVA